MGGMGADFYRNMVQEVGKTAMNKLEKERQIRIKADEQWYLNKIEEYEQQ
jgi:hypothetical protein